MLFSIKEIKKEIPILILIILVFILYINNMPVDFNFNVFGFIEHAIDDSDYGQYSNLKIFTISNIVLLCIFMYIYKISNLPQEELRNKIGKMSLFIGGFYLVLWGIMWWGNKYSSTKWLIKEKVINNVIVYESTVYPGCTEEVCIPVLEKFSKLKLQVQVILIVL